MTTKRILGPMLLAMLFVTMALLYVTGPGDITTGVHTCRTYEAHPLGSNVCTDSRHTIAWERVYYQIVPNDRTW
jgi:hypothetical protein